MATTMSAPETSSLSTAEEKKPASVPLWRDSFTKTSLDKALSQAADSKSPPPAYTEIVEAFSRTSISSTHSEDKTLTGGGESSASKIDEIAADEDDKEGQELVDHAAAFLDNKTPADLSNLPRLSRPILIPRLKQETTAPLVRAYPPEAQRFAMDKESFVTLLDNFNVVSQAPPGTILLYLAAFGISFIPWDGADGIALLTELMAIGVSHAIVMRRCHNYIGKMNEEYFHPRGLHARLINTKKMRKVLNIPTDDSLIAPLSEETLDLTAYERCMARMEERYSCPLTTDVPDPSPQTKILARFAAWKVRQDCQKFNKRAKWSRKRAWKKHLKGKPPRSEGYSERCRVRHLQWLLIQNHDEFQQQEEDRIAQEAEKKKLKRGFTWKSLSSVNSGLSDEKKL